MKTEIITSETDIQIVESHKSFINLGCINQP